MNDILIRGASHLWTGLPGAAMRCQGGADVRVRGGVISAIGTLTPRHRNTTATWRSSSTGSI